MTRNPLTDAQASPPDTQEREIERYLRPRSFDDFTGQREILSNLSVFVQAARMRSESLDHVLLHGPPGLGKTTLAHIIANVKSRISIPLTISSIS